jgi:hypothetical protein
MTDTPYKIVEVRGRYNIEEEKKPLKICGFSNIKEALNYLWRVSGGFHNHAYIEKNEKVYMVESFDYGSPEKI